ncbi:unnamed protein product [Absidia cylindrospora]
MKVDSNIVGALRGAKKDISSIVVPLLKNKDITIGRAASNTIVIKSPFVSQQHCRIFSLVTSDGIHMTCVEALNEASTWVNGACIGKHNYKVLFTGCTLTIALEPITFYFIGLGKAHGKWLRTTPMNWIDGRELVVSNELIGQGSQSKVFLVGPTFPCHQQLVCRRTHPVKLFGNELDYHRKRLKNEVNMLLKLRHPNIIRLLSYTINPDQTWSMLFPLVCGVNLERYTSIQHGKKSLHQLQIQFIMYQLFSATKYIHSSGIIHKDLKPSNILVYKTRMKYPRIVVVDFGLAVNVKTEKRWSHSEGTKSYLAPEIVADDSSCTPFDYKVDCWSLGLIMYQLLTMAFPFELKNRTTTAADMDELETWEKHRKWILEEQLDLEADPIWSSVSAFAKDLLTHLLEKDPRKRYSSQQAFDSDFIQHNNRKSGLMEGHLRVWSAYLEQVSSTKIDTLPTSCTSPQQTLTRMDVSTTTTAASSSNSNNNNDLSPSTLTTTTSSSSPSSHRLPPIHIGTPIPIPGNKAQRDTFFAFINQATPMHFEDGRPMHPMP